MLHLHVRELSLGCLRERRGFVGWWISKGGYEEVLILGVLDMV